jgi:hypothetical protein
MTENKSQRPFGKIKFFYPNGRGGTFQETGETATPFRGRGLGRF